MTTRKLDTAIDWLRRTAVTGDSGIADGDLLERFVASGDESAFELLVWRHQRLVYGVCHRVLRDAHDAEDAFQAVFLILARKGRTVARSASVAAWLYKVAYRCALTARSVRAKKMRREQPLAAAGECAEASAALSLAERNELGAILDEELSRLPERFRTPTVLCYLAGKTVDEAAVQLGCPRGTVASRLARARKQLRIRLIGRGVTLPAGLTALAIGATVDASPSHLLVSATVTLLRRRTAGSVSATTAAALAERVLRTMFLRKLVLGFTAAAFAVAVLLGGSVALHSLAQAPEVPQPGAKQAPPEKPGPAPAPKAKPAPSADFVGTLEQSQEVQVRSRVGGQIDCIHVKEGDDVKKGDLLFEIDARRAKVDLQQALAELAQAEARAKSAAVKLARLKTLHASASVPRGVVDAAAQDDAVAEASVKGAQATVERAGLELNAHRIVAPIAGRIVRLPVDAGNLIAAGGTTVLATLVVVDPMTLRFAMDERSFLRYQKAKRAGQDKEIVIRFAIMAADEDGFPHVAKLVHVGNTFDPATRTVAVRAAVANSDRLLLPGWFVRVRVTFAPALEKAAP